MGANFSIGKEKSIDFAHYCQKINIENCYHREN